MRSMEQLPARKNQRREKNPSRRKRRSEKSRRGMTPRGVWLLCFAARCRGASSCRLARHTGEIASVSAGLSQLS